MLWLMSGVRQAADSNWTGLGEPTRGRTAAELNPTLWRTIVRYTRIRRLGIPLVAAVCVAVAGNMLALSADDDLLSPGNLLLSRSVYNSNPANIVVGTSLPPGCADTSVGCPKKGGKATNDGTLPLVWNNSLADSSFGITSKILLDQLTPSGKFVNTLEVPNSTQPGVSSTDDQLVTSFPSKSELALNLSTDGRHVSFMGYVAPVGAVDVSNANTPLVVDPTNPVGTAVYRAAADLDRHGRFHFTLTNAYSGNNGRAAILHNENGYRWFFTAGNAGNGGNPQPDGIIIGAGAQIMTRERAAEVAQVPGLPAPVGSFNITQLGLPHDKIGKDTNFRGLTVFHNVLFYTKGSGGNGINTVYFVDTTGAACPGTSPMPGIGLPVLGASLPNLPMAYDSSHAGLQGNGVTPTNMCILAGFPTLLANSSTGVTNPFGLWFADDHTLYVADEGDGVAGPTPTSFYDHARSQRAAGLQKWVLDGSTHKWTLLYTLQSGLALGVPYTVTGYPTGNNPGTGLPWSPATDGLRNITGRVNRDGTVTIWAITSTISGNGDQGADPNRLVAVSERLSATTADGARFTTVRAAGYGEVLRGVSFTPGTTALRCDDRPSDNDGCRDARNDERDERGGRTRE
jgi:hypothetical protein